MKVPILLPNIFNHPFTYKSDISLKTGDYVIVPFGKTKLTGVVWDHFETNNKKNFQTKIKFWDSLIIFSKLIDKITFNLFGKSLFIVIKK